MTLPDGAYGLERRPGESGPMYLARVTEARLAADRLAMLETWDHSNYRGTPETYRKRRVQEGALARLYQDGWIDIDQLAMAEEIAGAAEMIQREVEVRAASYEMRVDFSGSARDALIEGIIRVQIQVAYSWWRRRLPEPRQAVLDMLIGEQIPYSTAALRYRMGKARTRKLLIAAIDLWGEAIEQAEATVDKASLAAAHAAIL